MTDIKLPPLPTHTLDREEVYSGIAVNKVCTVLYYTEAQLRARDIEVARVVLEAAAKVLEENAPQCSLQLETFVLLCNAVSIRNLEIGHD